MIRTKHKNVNSKTLVKAIDEYVIDELISEEANWEDPTIRIMSLEFIDIVMEDHKSQGQIDHWKIYSDKRNNSPEMIAQSIYTLNIEFKQSHCLNTTKLVYTFGVGLKN